MRKLVLTLLMLGASLTVRAAEPVYTKDGVAIGGIDPVAYFTEGRPEPGKPEIETQWNGARWRFATTAHRDAFKAEPTRYAPQFGGYCAYGVAKGHTVKTEPDAWRIVNGKLYLNYDKKVQELWEKELPAVIGEAEGQWPAVLTK